MHGYLFWASALAVPVFLLIIALYFMWWMDDIDINISKVYKKMNFGALFLKDIGANFILFKYLYVEQSDVYENEKKNVLFFDATIAIAGLPNRVNVIILKKESQVEPRLSIRLNYVRKKADEFYGGKVKPFTGGDFKRISKIFGRGNFFTFHREIWIERNKLGYLIVIPGKIGKKEFYTELEDFLLNA